MGPDELAAAEARMREMVRAKRGYLGPEYLSLVAAEYDRRADKLELDAEEIRQYRISVRELRAELATKDAPHEDCCPLGQDGDPDIRRYHTCDTRDADVQPRLIGPMTRRIGQLGITLRRLVLAVERDDGEDMTPLWDRAKAVLADDTVVADLDLDDILAALPPPPDDNDEPAFSANLRLPHPDAPECHVNGGDHRWGTGRDRDECADCDAPRPHPDAEPVPTPDRMLSTSEARAYIRSVLIDPETMPSGQPRARCRKCRNFLWDGAYLGQFCTPDCAEIKAKVDEAWALITFSERHYCPVCRSHTGHPKQTYHDADEADADAARLTQETGKPYRAYTCRRGNLHVGSRGSVSP